MHASTFITAIILSSLSVSAGPHDNMPRRRHHARRAVVPAQLVEKIKRESTLVAQSRASCTNGDWQCIGSQLQRCNFDTWISIQNCTGDNVICSADSKAIGCVWTWSVDDANDTPVTVSPVPSMSFSSTSAGPSPTKDAGSIANANGNADKNNGEESSATQQSSSTAVSSPSPSLIGGMLYAGDTDGDAQSSSSRRGRKHKTSSVPDWYGATSTDDWGASSTNDWSQSSATDSPSTSRDWYNVGGQSTASTSTSNEWNAQSSGGSDVASTSRHGGKASATSSSFISQPTGVTPSGDYNAPHYVIYADQWLQRMPEPGDLSAYNRFILAFWMTTGGAVDNAQAWEQFDADYRQQVLDSYHAAGIALMVSAFGSTDSPTTNGVDPTDCAQQLAAWVKQYGLDGVDIDYEDMNAMNNDQAEAWLITFQNELRRQLPAPYLISHAPVAPWFTSGNNYPSGAYVSVWKQTGHGIDFFNVQFYNQGNNVYEDCQSLLTDSGNSWPDTSVFGINSYAGVPLNKIVIGKPIDAGAASNGYMDGSTLAQCVAQAQSKGWNGGVMFWEWSALIGNSLMAEVRG